MYVTVASTADTPVRNEHVNMIGSSFILNLNQESKKPNGLFSKLVCSTRTGRFTTEDTESTENNFGFHSVTSVISVVKIRSE